MTDDNFDQGDAAIIHHLLDAANALEHLRIDLARIDASATVKERAKIIHRELQKALSLLRDDP
jgi:hypothetical protein